VFFCGFVAGDEDAVESAVADLDGLQGGEVGTRQVFFVRPVQMGRSAKAE